MNKLSNDFKKLGTFDMVNFIEYYGKQMWYPDVLTQLDNNIIALESLRKGNSSQLMARWGDGLLVRTAMHSKGSKT